MLNVQCNADRAVVPVTGVIEEEMMLRLVAAVRQLHNEYYYMHIELEVCSPGGQAIALNYCIETMDALRARGVRFLTRAQMSVSSAAAILVSLGDAREAARGATFLYHQARAVNMDTVTAQSARQILTAVDKFDDRYLTRLVARARRGERPRTGLHPRDFAENDWPIIEHLLIGAGAVQAQAGRARLSRKALLPRLRKHVGDCLRDEDERPLKLLYRGLYEMDKHISAGLALELGLIDAISDDRALAPDETMTDRVRIPEWAPLFDSDGLVSRLTLCRHTLALGETGSGKTVSGILPVIGSIMAPENTMVGCTLIIDPKHEIRRVIGQLAHPGITVNDVDVECERRPVLNLMDGYGASLRPALDDGQYLEAARQILIRSASLSPMSAARALTDSRVDDRDIYWAGEGARLAQTVLGLTLLILAHRRHIFGDNETSGLIERANPGMRALLAEFGREAGLLVEHRDIVALVQDARDALRGIRELWADAKQRQEQEEQAAEEAESRRRRERYIERDEPVALRQGLFSQQDGLLVPCALADELKAAAQQGAGDADSEEPDAETSFKQWREAAAFVMESFADAIRSTPLYRNSRRFREAVVQKLAASVGLVYQSLLDDTLPAIEQFALHPLPDESIRPSPNIMALAHSVLQSFFKASRCDNKKDSYNKKSSTEDMPVMSLIGLLKDEIQGGQLEAIYQLIEHSWNPMARAEYQGQYVGVYGYARTCFTDFADKTPAWTLYFGCEPYYRSVMAHGRADFLPVDFSRDVDETDPARRCLYVFQPRLDQNEAIVAKALKAAFFEAVLANRRRRQDGQSMPLVGYVADEFHRFVTSDPNHGEQSYLDTCRSFGAFCVLACQSIASLEHALAGTDNNEVLNRAAVSILLNNTGNKLFFRSTDRALFERVEQLCPGGGALGKLTHVRPLSTLRPGECYASLSDGRFERRQLLPFKAAECAAAGTVVRMQK